MNISDFVTRGPGIHDLKSGASKRGWPGQATSPAMTPLSENADGRDKPRP